MIKNFILFKKYYDFQLWLIPILNKFPKNQKYTLAEKIHQQSLKILDLIIQIAQNQIKIRRKNLKTFIRKLRKLQDNKKRKQLTASWKGYTKPANTYNLNKKLGLSCIILNSQISN